MGTAIYGIDQFTRLMREIELTEIVEEGDFGAVIRGHLHGAEIRIGFDFLSGRGEFDYIDPPPPTPNGTTQP